MMVRNEHIEFQKEVPNICRVLKGGMFFRGGGKWGTLKIPRQDWRSLGEFRGRLEESPPPVKNPIK